MPDPCLFCRIVAEQEPAHVVLDEGDVVGFLDVRPVFEGDGLRGFFWPRTKYADADAAASVAEQLRTAI